MSIKPYLIVFSVSFGIVIVGAVVGDALEAFGIITAARDEVLSPLN